MTVKSGQSDGTITVTPSGIPVYFQSQPKRCYRLGPEYSQGGLSEEELLAEAQAETEGWREVVSVTTALDALNKGGLSWWGMGIGASGVTMLTNLGFVKQTVLPGGQQPILACPKIWEVE